MAKTKQEHKKRKTNTLGGRWLFFGGLLIGLVLFIGGWLVSGALANQPKEAPEAQRVLDLQANMPFQILIPSYLPKGYQRGAMDIQINDQGPSGEPMVLLTYTVANGPPLFIKEWVPVNPGLEILASSRPVETKWGKGWLLKQGDGLIALWSDIGPLRVSIYTGDQRIINIEHLLAIAENMGPASNRQVFSFVVNPPTVREVKPPAPVEIPINAEGVQEVDLIITPGGYSPLRFSVKQGVPVRLTFRQLGEVGCGNELNFPVNDGGMEMLRLETPTDKKVLEYTPYDVGEFQFFCGHLMYRGIVTVRE